MVGKNDGHDGCERLLCATSVLFTGLLELLAQKAERLGLDLAGACSRHLHLWCLEGNSTALIITYYDMSALSCSLVYVYFLYRIVLLCHDLRKLSCTSMWAARCWGAAALIIGVTYYSLF